MKEEIAKQVVEKLNKGLLQIVNDKISKELGVKANFNITESNRWNEYQVYLKEDGIDTTSQLTATPLLRSMFKDAELYVRVGYSEVENVIWFSVYISYNHKSGGSNGLELLNLAYDNDNNEVKY